MISVSTVSLSNKEYFAERIIPVYIKCRDTRTPIIVSFSYSNLCARRIVIEFDNIVSELYPFIFIIVTLTQQSYQSTHIIRVSQWLYLASILALKR